MPANLFYALFAVLNQSVIAALQRAEVVAGVFVMAIIFMLIIPMPLIILDSLIAFNICLSALLVMLTLYLPRPLAFSSFPTVLLLTTLFRLALSVSTTRQILIQQDAGYIVNAFGNFVAGGNLTVGLVMFFVLTIVNFLVITKGAERVAEVAARFNLDAMPGKQMSIDSDLRAGLIDAPQALSRRSELNQESQLFGAMDGAMKFVKGDAIAGLVILFINLIGGFSIGVWQREMEWSQALDIYTILTIGDGLISQIPALLVSLTCGMVITRVSADTVKLGNNIGREIGAQLVSQPRAWVLASFLMAAFALLPGMPVAIFLTLALATLLVGGVQIWRQRQRDLPLSPAAGEAHEPAAGEDVRQFAVTQPYLLQLADNLRDTPDADSLIQQVRQLRNQIVTEFGFTLPNLQVSFSADFAADEVRFLVDEVPWVSGMWGSDWFAFHVEQLDSQEKRPSADASDSRLILSHLWCRRSHPLLADSALTAHTAPQIVLPAVEQALYASAAGFIGLNECYALINGLALPHPELAQELLRVMPLSRVATVLQQLVSERVSLRALRTIAQTLVEYGQYENHINTLTERVRVALKSSLCHQYAQPDGLPVWLLEPETESLLRDSLRQSESEIFFAISRHQAQTLLSQLRAGFVPPPAAPVVLLCAQDLRSAMHRLVHEEFAALPVLAFSELISTLTIQVRGVISLEPHDEESVLEDEDV